jgi:hypothetical protein
MTFPSLNALSGCTRGGIRNVSQQKNHWGNNFWGIDPTKHKFGLIPYSKKTDFLVDTYYII